MITKKVFVILLFACFLYQSEASAQTNQTSKVEWSSFNMGFAIPTSTSNMVESTVGQAFVGGMQQGDTRFESGFLAYTALGTTTPVEEVPETGLPSSFELHQNYPNPFNPTTKIEFSLPQPSLVRITVYDILGVEVVALLDETRPAENYTVAWNGLDSKGTRVSSGVYFYRLEATAPGGQAPFISLKKMLLLK